VSVEGERINTHTHTHTLTKQHEWRREVLEAERERKRRRGRGRAELRGNLTGRIERRTSQSQCRDGCCCLSPISATEWSHGEKE